MIYVHPYGGICNRMRCIDSAVHLGRKANQGVCVVWEENTDLNARFKDLFQSTSAFSVRPTCPWLFRRENNAQREFQYLTRRVLRATRILRVLEGKLKVRFRDPSYAADVCRFRHIYIRSEDRFMYPELYDAFTPTASILQEVERNAACFSEDTVGIHIRRTDHKTAIRESPLELFVSRMKRRLADVPATRFYLATDDRQVKDDVCQRFGPQVITRTAELRRDSTRGILDALIDLYTLARTPEIWGSYGSSFCETAHYLGKNRFELIRHTN